MITLSSYSDYFYGVFLDKSKINAVSKSNILPCPRQARGNTPFIPTVHPFQAGAPPGDQAISPMIQGVPGVL